MGNKVETREEILYVDFITYLVEKLHMDNSWLIERLAEFSSEND
jgi:hypothetical protein